MRSLLFLALAFVPIATVVSADFSDWSVQQTRLMLANVVFAKLRDEIQEKGSTAVKSLDSQVTLTIATAGPQEPRSTIGNGVRKIVVPDTFVAKTINLARLMQLARDSTDLGCVATYKVHMENTGSRTVPERYLELTVPICATFMVRLPLTLEQEVRAQQELEATLVFTYLHELGHQYHNHQGVPMPPNVNNKVNQCTYLRALDMRRKMEYEADAFAVDALVSLGHVELVFSMVSLWLAPPMDPDPATIASNAMLTQRLAAHPYSPFRFARILDRASEELSRQPGTSPELIQLIQQMKDVQNRAAEVIAESDAELSPC